MTRRIGFSLLSIALICVLLALFFLREQHAPENDQVSPSSVNDHSTEHAENLENEVSNLRNEVRLWKNSNEELERKLAEARTQEGKPKTENVKRNNTKQANSDSIPINTKERLKQESRFIEEEVIPELEYKLNQEQDDKAWSNNAERKLKDAFWAVEPKGSILASVECRTTFCRLEIDHEGMRAREKYMANLFDTLPWPKSNIFYHTQNYQSWDKGENNGRLTTFLYYSRQGKDLPPTPTPP